MKNPPIFIIGAGRSGTNMLRDCICSLPAIKTWPCDEINYIWRHGNKEKKTDRFTADDVNLKAKKYILKSFELIEKKLTAQHIVEKTCANSLRIPFIDAIFPNGKYICIVRDGFDVASSAAKRWKAPPLDLPYIWAKAKYVPKSDFIHYAYKYAWNRIKKIFSKDKRLAFWGPLYPGIYEDLKIYDAEVVSAKQWSISVKTALNDLKSIDPSRVFYVRYEEFVSEPVDEMENILNFLNLHNFTKNQINNSVDMVSKKSVGKSKSNLSKADLNRLGNIINPTQELIDLHFSEL